MENYPKDHIIMCIKLIHVPYELKNFNIKKKDLIEFYKKLKKLNFDKFQFYEKKNECYRIRNFNLFYFYDDRTEDHYIDDYKIKMNFLYYIYKSINQKITLKEFFNQYKLKSYLNDYFNKFYYKNTSMNKIINDIKNLKHYNKKKEQKLYTITF